MKTSHVLLGIALWGVSLSVLADRYQFIAADDSIETKICIAAASDDKLKLRKVSRHIQHVPTAMSSEYKRMRVVANTVKCNGDYVANFAHKYDANTTYQYLNRYTKPSLRLTPTTTIRDITASNSETDKVIRILVATR